ncbi:MAG: hypothetical protein C4547_13530 [Phycisphaerales bacterium]|nr:MAG: hypothetical protein C4547_13530 [Phycisphaerales bacterium]
MIELMTRRWADEVRQRYGLDDRQQAAWADGMADRWTRFSRQYRERMAPIVNQFIEMRLDMKPPTADEVRAFAEKAGPAFDLFRAELVAGGQELRDLLKPGQRARFDTDMMGMTAALETARKKLDLWQSGEFNERDFWDPPRSERDRRRAEQNAAQTAEGAAGDAAGGGRPGDGGNIAPAAADSPPDQIEIELDNWQKYVERFIRTYKLDDPQTAAAHSILKELRERAIGHRDAHRQEIEDLERRIARHDGTPEELSELETRIADLYGPIDQLFEQLKSRLDGIPTQGQRDGVGRREQQEGQRR